MTTFGPCVDCGVKGISDDCAMYVCKDKDGFYVVCCIVFAISNGLSICKSLGNLNEKED